MRSHKTISDVLEFDDLSLPVLSVVELDRFMSSLYHVQASKGLLGGILGRERAERAKRADEMPRHSRFGGQYRVAMTSSK